MLVPRSPGIATERLRREQSGQAGGMSEALAARPKIRKSEWLCFEPVW